MTSTQNPCPFFFLLVLNTSRAFILEKLKRHCPVPTWPACCSGAAMDALASGVILEHFSSLQTHQFPLEGTFKVTMFHNHRLKRLPLVLILPAATGTKNHHSVCVSASKLKNSFQRQRPLLIQRVIHVKKKIN